MTEAFSAMCNEAKEAPNSTSTEGPPDNISKKDVRSNDIEPSPSGVARTIAQRTISRINRGISQGTNRGAGGAAKSLSSGITEGGAEGAAEGAARGLRGLKEHLGVWRAQQRERQRAQLGVCVG